MSNEHKEVVLALVLKTFQMILSPRPLRRLSTGDYLNLI